MVDIVLSNLTHDYREIASSKVPLSVGVIGAFLSTKIPDANITVFNQIKYIENLISEFPKNKKIIFGFSNFLWNQALNIAISKIIKSNFINSIIVFGGPNLSSDSFEREIFLKTNKQIDFYILDEGEYAFYKLVDLCINKNFNVEKVKLSNPNQTVFLHGDQLIETESLQRVEIINTPSPYTSGLLDAFLDKFAPLIQFTRGCPFTCTFCTEGKSRWMKIYRKDNDFVERELNYIAKNCNKNLELHIADSNFGMYVQDENNAQILKNTIRKYKWTKSILSSTGKNAKERVLRVSKILDGLISLSASVQSTDPAVLKAVKRKNIQLDDIFSVGLDGCSSDEFSSYADTILLLPGDTKEAHFNTIKDVIEKNIDVINLFQFTLLKGSEVDSSNNRKEFEMRTSFRIIPRCYGKYTFLGEKFTVAEIEEMCISNNSMSFDDYIACRKMHLVLEIFYNNKIFKEIYLILEEKGISKFDFLTYVSENLLDLQDLVDAFLNETKREIFPTYNGLESFFINNIEKFSSGEFGSNLLYKYKIKSTQIYMEEVLKVVFKSLRYFLILGERERDYVKLNLFLTELEELMSCRYSDMLNTSKFYQKTFSYNFLKLGINSLSIIISNKEKIKLNIRHTIDIRDMVNYKLNTMDYGTTSKSIILSQIRMDRCFRKLTLC